MRSNVFDALLSVVVSESGCGEGDLAPEVAFADIGMDSLMAITYHRHLPEDTGIELPATFFLDHTTVKEAKEALLSSCSSPPSLAGQSVKTDEEYDIVPHVADEAVGFGLFGAPGSKS